VQSLEGQLWSPFLDEGKEGQNTKRILHVTLNGSGEWWENGRLLVREADWKALSKSGF
jgi:hypothetical protein